MRSVRFPILALLGMFALVSAHPADLAADHGNDDRNDRGKEKISIEDDCDPRDVVGWTGGGGCLQRTGNVRRAEFDAFLVSPNSLSTVGHPAWQNNPSYLILELGERLRLKNNGGRGHTFTEVPQYGGGFILGLNIGLTKVDQCVQGTTPVILPGGRAEIQGLGLGNHKFQCCIHPWMRALVKVQADD